MSVQPFNDNNIVHGIVKIDGDRLRGVRFLKIFRWAHNFFDMCPFLTRPVPIESPHRGISIGAGPKKNALIYNMLLTY